MENDSTCRLEGCERPPNSSLQPLCNAHYLQWRRGKPFKDPIVKSGPLGDAVCEVSFCDEVQSARGYCRYHYGQASQGRQITARPGPRHRATARDEEGRKRCPVCEEWKAPDNFRPNGRNSDGLESRCVPCRAQQQAEYRREWKYGVTPDEFEEMLAVQLGACLVCGDRSPRYWVVDHDHSCCPGEKSCGTCVRAVLRSHCNLALGSIRDNAETARAMSDYLQAMSVGA